METLIEWLPRVGAALTVLMGLVGFFKPTLVTDAQKIALGSNMAKSEARVVFGGLHLGSGIAALWLLEPVVFITLGAAWLVGLLARFYSMVADGTSLQDSMGGIIIDGLLAFLFLSGLIFG